MKHVLVFASSPDYASHPAFRIRILALAPAMRRRGYDWEVRVRPKTPWGRISLARAARNYHGVILHRKMLDPYEARILREHVPPPGRILMDIDDATMYSETQLGVVAQGRLDRRLQATARIIDVVCAGNDYLGRILCEHGAKGVRLTPSVVEPSEYPVKKHTAGRETRLVWIGSRSTLKYLEQSFGAMREAATRVTGLKLVVICDQAPDNAPLPVAFVPWTLETEKRELLRGDIGIAPTPEDRWTLGKCGFKIVQYMAAGLPVIASPVGVNAALVNGKNAAAGGEAAGLLPATPDEWVAAVERLAGDLDLREKMGAAGRARVERELCVERMADQWAEALG